jgi:TRAP-type C4-dicarboxylate transport system permease small subunit
MLQKLIDQIARLLSLLMVVSLALMVVLVFTNVVLRYAFNSGLTVSEELSRWLFVWMTFLGAFVGLHDKSHLGTDTLIAKLPVAGKRVCFLLAHVLMLFCAWLIFRGAWDQVVINYETTSPVMEVSMALFYGSGLVFSVLAGLILSHDLFKLLAGRLSEGELIGVRESDDMPHGDPHA